METDTKEHMADDVDFSVRVVRGDDETVPHVGVMVSFTGFGRGYLEATTDSDGVAYFNAEPGEGKVFVDGDYIETYYFDDGDQVTVNIDSDDE